MNHYNMMARLDALQMSGEMAHLHAPVREAFRKANMKGQQITDMARLKMFCPAWAFAPLSAALAA